MIIQVDGTPGVPPRGTAGIGVVVRNAAGAVITWHCTRAPARTNNEAEYQAVIAGLALALREFRGAQVRCLTDSQIVVEQVMGRAAVRAPALQPLHAQALTLMRQVGQVVFVPIPRELNRLADALAWEALDGQGWVGRAGR